MTDLEISRELALAIGYKPENMRENVEYLQGLEVKRLDGPNVWYWWYFDYTCWEVVGPIAQVYNCFPFCSYSGWTTMIIENNYETPQKAIALSVLNKTGGHRVY